VGLFSVRPLVTLQRFSTRERFVADVALTRLHASVKRHMCCQTTSMSECFGTHIASVGLLKCEPACASPGCLPVRMTCHTHYTSEASRQCDPAYYYSEAGPGHRNWHAHRSCRISLPCAPTCVPAGCQPVRMTGHTGCMCGASPLCEQACVSSYCRHG
jgi:hypothetical protein